MSTHRYNLRMSFRLPDFVRTALIASVVALALFRPAAAQMRIDVSGVGATQFPIAIGTFAAEGRIPQDVAEVVRADLTRSGAFRLVDPRWRCRTPPPRFPDPARPRRPMRCSAAPSPPGGRPLRRQVQAERRGAPGLASAARRSGQRGRPAARRAPIARLGLREADRRTRHLLHPHRLRLAPGHPVSLNVADWDGENVQTPLTSAEPIISASWSPRGHRLAYVSFERKKPIVVRARARDRAAYSRSPTSGQQQRAGVVARRTHLAVALTRDGLSQLYLVAADGGGVQRRPTIVRASTPNRVLARRGEHLFHLRSRRLAADLSHGRQPAAIPLRDHLRLSYNVSPPAPTISRSSR